MDGSFARLRRSSFLEEEVTFPIKVANGSLLEESTQFTKGLRGDLELHKDYFLVPELLWRKLLSWNVFTIDCDIATVLTSSINDE
jgi:hypothetical protein